MFNQDELKNLLALVQRANITGAEATTAAFLIQKIGMLMNPAKEAKKEEKKPEKQSEEEKKKDSK